jgi:hypothetical protein
MPQLDLMHFFSQFFWFSLFFIFLFFYTYLNILPLLLKNLKYRSKKLVVLSFAISHSKKNIFSLCFFHDNIISNSFRLISKSLTYLIIFCASLINKKLIVMSINLLCVINLNYYYFLIINVYKNFILDKK